MCNKEFQRRLGHGKRRTRRVQEAMCDTELSEMALVRQIGPTCGQSQAESEKVIHAVVEDSKFSSSSRCGGMWVGSGDAKGARVRNLLQLKTRK